jgi:hypothetical protein
LQYYFTASEFGPNVTVYLRNRSGLALTHCLYYWSLEIYRNGIAIISNNFLTYRTIWLWHIRLGLSS